MTTAKTTAAKKTASKKSPAKKPAAKPAAKSGSETNACWPGFEPVPGKAHNEKGSCKPKPGKKSTAVKQADQKAAAASKLRKQAK